MGSSHDRHLSAVIETCSLIEIRVSIEEMYSRATIPTTGSREDLGSNQTEHYIYFSLILVLTGKFYKTQLECEIAFNALFSNRLSFQVHAHADIWCIISMSTP